ncbi:MAG: helix-turn-helix domain-containing protein [Puniceicoccales bacterium]
MKTTTPHDLCDTESPAPALNRGLALLVALGNESPRSLDSLCNELNLPKASVFRLLDTLVLVGMVRKMPDKRYQPLWRLQPVGDPRELFRESMRAKMATLCESTGCTIEWYETAPEGMLLTLQANPNSELCVKAQPGYLRDWSTEFEAVARLGAAFASEAPEVTATRAYKRNGEIEALSIADIEQLLTDARNTQSAVDTAYNINGVRRIACVALDENGALVGVLALAEAYHFNQRDLSSDYLKQLKSVLN